MTLPGILPPDAGRLERAARRYAIAVLSRRMAGGWYLDALASIDWAAATMRRVSGWVADDGSTPITSASHARPSLRLLRARVALYLRWCERVERLRDGDWRAEWRSPLWTLAPAHDPAVTAAERRQRKENR